jgi:hypothetical protein
MVKKNNIPGTITLKLSVSDELHAKVAHRAASEGLSISAWVKKIMRNPPPNKYRMIEKMQGKHEL